MYIADLHIHSRYAYATSKDCTPEMLDFWARRKGIDLLGTGDFTHPAWRAELKEKLEPAGNGFYRLKEAYRIRSSEASDSREVWFVAAGEISSIYKKNGKTRKVHSLVLLPGLEAADKISARLQNIGNLHSDGRPILGFGCRDLLELVLEECREAIYVPAHIWTPHFALFGAKSGFDRMEECFEDLTPYVRAVETGLSSDPPMNWQISALDGCQLISNPTRILRESWGGRPTCWIQGCLMRNYMGRSRKERGFKEPLSFSRRKGNITMTAIGSAGFAKAQCRRNSHRESVRSAGKK